MLYALARALLMVPTFSMLGIVLGNNWKRVGSDFSGCV